MELGRIISPTAVRAALALARAEFDKLDGVIPEGRQEFYRFTEYTVVTGQMLAGQLKLWGMRDRELRGMSAMRGDAHISMLFVQDGYRGHGIGRALCETMADAAREHGATTLTVNAEPTSQLFYERMGFAATGDLAQHSGIQYVPMRLDLA